MHVRAYSDSDGSDGLPQLAICVSFSSMYRRDVSLSDLSETVREVATDISEPNVELGHLNISDYMNYLL